jgi:tripartite-type tricarboxylate transporter receptor subunit TctC
MQATRVTRRHLLAAGTGALAGFPSVLRAQTGAWPNRPVRIINPYGPGGTADIMVRPLTEKLERAFGRPFIVENRPGAGGSIGTGVAAAERPDGHALLVSNTGPLAVAPAVFRNLTYDPARAFSWIAMLGGAPILCAVKAGGPVRSLPDYIAAAKAAPEAVTFGSSGIASAGHLAGALFSMEVGAQLLHIPFRSAAEAQQSLLGGNVGSLWDTLAPQAEAVRAGSLLGLAVTSAERVPAVPEVPTVAELGLPAVTSNNWFLLAGPAGMDPAIVARLHQVVAETFAEPATRQRLVNAGIVSLGDPSPEEIGRFVAAEGARWGRVVRAANVQVG